MGKFYDNSIIPQKLKRNFDVYERIKNLGIDLGTYSENVTNITKSGLPIASVVFHESGLFPKPFKLENRSNTIRRCTNIFEILVFPHRTIFWFNTNRLHLFVRTAPHRSAPHRTAPHFSEPHRTDLCRKHQIPAFKKRSGRIREDGKPNKMRFFGLLLPSLSLALVCNGG